jgi:hypothetical protein
MLAAQEFAQRGLARLQPLLVADRQAAADEKVAHDRHYPNGEDSEPAIDLGNGPVHPGGVRHESGDHHDGGNQSQHERQLGAEHPEGEGDRHQVDDPDGDPQRGVEIGHQHANIGEHNGDVKQRVITDLFG